MKDRENETKLLLSNYVKTRCEKLDAYPSIISSAMDCISGAMPFKLKLAITLSELISFTSHLRKPIQLHDGTLVPTNAIFFALAGSGQSKDKSLNAIRKSLSSGYTQMEDQRKEFARTKAESTARLEGDEATNWAKYYKAPKSLQCGLGTVEGLVQHFADLSENPIGAGSILSNEIGSELQTNGNMIDIIKTISIAYDLGNIPPKIVKSSENQTSEIKGLPINALFFGAQEAILFDNQIRNKFKLVFNTQLARRSMFTFSPEATEKLYIKSIDELYKLREAERERVCKAQEYLNDLTSKLVLDTTSDPLTISKDAMRLFDVYLESNAITSDSMSNKFPISKLSRRHKQWLALKLSGTYAILSGADHILEDHYTYAINTVELLSDDLSNFERELIKEPYEQLADYCKMNAEEGEFGITLHELRKLSYVTGTGASSGKIDELCKSANSYDTSGTYVSNDGGILYKEIVKTDLVDVTYKIFDTTLQGKELKDFMSRNSKDGYDIFQTSFEDLENLLTENAVYTPFKFIDGIRNKNNLIGGAKFVVLDIDKSVLTDDEAHILLGEYNHYILRTSNKDNEFKFRVIMEMDSIVDIDERLWKAFIKEVADELGLIVDLLPQSQIFISYAGREIKKNLEGKTLQSKFLIERAISRVKDAPKAPGTLPAKEKAAKLSDPRITFSVGFEAEPGERSSKMYRMLAYAIDLGADKEYIIDLANKINKYWSNPLDADRLEHTLVTPALRRLQEYNK